MLEQADDMSFVDFGAPAEPATSGYRPATAATRPEGAAEDETRNISEDNEKLVTQAGFEPATPSSGGWVSLCGWRPDVSRHVQNQEVTALA